MERFSIEIIFSVLIVLLELGIIVDAAVFS